MRKLWAKETLISYIFSGSFFFLHHHLRSPLLRRFFFFSALTFVWIISCYHFGDVVIHQPVSFPFFTLTFSVLMDLRSKASQWTQQLNIKRKFLKWFTLYFPSSLADGFLYSVNKNRQQNVRMKEKNLMKKKIIYKHRKWGRRKKIS